MAIKKIHLPSAKEGEQTLCGQRKWGGKKFGNFFILPLDQFMAAYEISKCEKCLKIHKSKAQNQ